ncbi:hypothetical protein CB0940_11083 [Cercospora beticola]|uniref:Secreted protein n=1 Tax=Cercospora beticola TaxID=122368 RepID=A0A2G5HE89_CERBT|nr:hypothetical protein CB0940_11083 [Cercospora beticola]PIA90583.1 hypothetical protein CB0940_11083 [Cercospora beticola]WPB07911.1 hypothetical protein RHO25_012575 [Cercospora beticola]CAK1368244.1 unnamed protein product [Cercospora beticola]
MKVIAIASLFAVSVMAQGWGNRQWGNRQQWDVNSIRQSVYQGPGFWGEQRWDCDGNQEGCYKDQCTCNRFDWNTWQLVQDDVLGERACWDLNSQYPNLVWQPGRGCIDLNNRGIEPHGMARACERQSWWPEDWVTYNCLPPW